MSGVTPSRTLTIVPREPVRAAERMARATEVAAALPRIAGGNRLAKAFASPSVVPARVRLAGPAFSRPAMPNKETIASLRATPKPPYIKNVKEQHLRALLDVKPEAVANMTESEWLRGLLSHIPEASLLARAASTNHVDGGTAGNATTSTVLRLESADIATLMSDANAVLPAVGNSIIYGGGKNKVVDGAEVYIPTYTEQFFNGVKSDGCDKAIQMDLTLLWALKGDI